MTQTVVLMKKWTQDWDGEDEEGTEDAESSEDEEGSEVDTETERWAKEEDSGRISEKEKKWAGRNGRPDQGQSQIRVRGV